MVMEIFLELQVNQTLTYPARVVKKQVTLAVGHGIGITKYVFNARGAMLRSMVDAHRNDLHQDKHSY